MFSFNLRCAGDGRSQDAGNDVGEKGRESRQSESKKGIGNTDTDGQIGLDGFLERRLDSVRWSVGWNIRTHVSRSVAVLGENRWFNSIENELKILFNNN